MSDIIGTICPACSGASTVTDSRPPGHHGNKHRFHTRRRRCDSCGHRWSTYEVPIEVFEASLLAREAVTEAIARLSAVRDTMDAITRAASSDTP